VVVTDSVAVDASFARHTGASLTVLNAATLFADAIRALEPDASPAHTGGPAR
jgi:hypothetical protein